MALKKFQIFTLICLQLMACTSASGNETVDVLIDRSISNLQKIKQKFKSFSLIKKIYGDCAPCKSIQNSKYCDCTMAEPMQDCLDFRKVGYKNNGIYRLNGPGFNRPHVFCDQTTQGGGWTTFLRREDGSLDFKKNWKDYKYGFGKMTNEFWLGNEIVHDLTKPSVAPKKSELLINMKIDGKTEPTYAKYDTFEIGDEASKYTLKISGASGNASSLTGTYSFLGYHNNMKFSTFDSNNDNAASGDCSNGYDGVGWWFNNCFQTILTGKYATRLYWNGQSSEKANFVEMKFRRKI